VTYDCSKYKGLKKRLCEGWKPDETGKGWRKLSDNEHERFMASFEGRPVPELDKPAIKKLAKTRVYLEGVGTELEKLFSNFSFDTCGACARLKSDLNQWGPDKCEKKRTLIIRRLEDNAKRKAVLKAVFTKTAAGMFVDQAIHNTRLIQQGLEPPKGIIGNLLSVAGNIFKPKKKKHPRSTMKWEYGITTVPSRLHQLLPRTINSLSEAGFDKPHLFIDGCTDPSVYDKFNLNYTCHSNRSGIAANWVASMWELYAGSSHADRYAIFQDDFVTYRNLKKYLEEQEYPKDGYCNLYTFPQNDRKISGKETGWHASNQRGFGAVALVFSNEAVTKLLTANHLIGRAMNPEKGHKFIDGGIVDSFKSFGWKEYVHNPSLVQHTGAISSHGPYKNPLSPSFRGEPFDAMELLDE
jgi:hypothetical protein